MMNRTRYRLVLEALPGNWRVEPAQRLRAALKRLLRNYGLRCVACRPVAPVEELRDRQPSQPPSPAPAVPAVESEPEQSFQ